MANSAMKMIQMMVPATEQLAFAPHQFSQHQDQPGEAQDRHGQSQPFVELFELAPSFCRRCHGSLPISRPNSKLPPASPFRMKPIGALVRLFEKEAQV